MMGRRTHYGNAVEKDIGTIDGRQHEVAVRILPHGSRRRCALGGVHAVVKTADVNDGERDMTFFIRPRLATVWR